MGNERFKNKEMPDRQGKFEQQLITCPRCSGTGKTNYPNQKRAAACPTCKGKGTTPA